MYINRIFHVKDSWTESKMYTNSFFFDVVAFHLFRAFFFPRSFCCCYRHRTVTEQHTMRKSCKNKPTEQEKKHTNDANRAQSEAEKYVNCDYCVFACTYYVLCLNIYPPFIVYNYSQQDRWERERQKKEKRKKSTENWLQYSINTIREYIDCAYERYFAFHLRVHNTHTTHGWEISLRE